MSANTKYVYDTKQGVYRRDRSAAEVRAQRDYEYQLRAEARRTVARLRQRGKRVVVYYSNSFNAANRGLCVLPNPRVLETGELAWQVR